MRLRPGTVTVVLTGLLLTLASPVTAEASQKPSKLYQEYVALGDSWSADVFTTLPTDEFVPLDCAQSPTNYPHQVAESLGIPTFRDATCGSATSDHFAQPQALPLGGVAAPQFAKLSPTTDLVTVGIGGNDIGLAAAVGGCLNAVPLDLLGLPAPLGTPCTSGFTTGGRDVFQQAIARTEPMLRRAMRQIHRRSPQADIYLVNYLNGLPVDGKGCWPVVPVTDGDATYLQRTFLSLNAMLKRVARKNKHVKLINTYKPTLGHDVCKGPGVSYIEGLIPVSLSNPLLVAFPFHPNQLGADAQARIVTEKIRKHAK